MKIDLTGLPYAFFLALIVIPAVYANPVSKDGNGLSNEVIKKEDIVYGYGVVNSDNKYSDPQTVELMLDLWVPGKNDTQLKPLLIYIHGGGFKGTMKKNIRKHQLFYKLGEYFVPKGWAVASIEYRVKNDFPLSPPGNWAPSFIGKGTVRNIEFPEVHAAVRDTKAAIRWFRAKGCRDFAIDPNRVYLVGTSAGACTALGAALDEDDFIDDGPKDTTALRNNPGYDAKPNAAFVIAGRDIFVSEDVFFGRNKDLVSWPIEYSDYDAQDPPIAVWHGSEDKLIPVEYGIDIYNRCQGAKIRSKKFIITGGGHVCWNCEYDGKPILFWIENFIKDIF